MYPVYRLLATINSFAPTILRLVLTTVFFVHGSQKTLGWFGGPGWSVQMAQWNNPDGLDVSYSLAAVGILAEVVGAAGMLVGFCTRLVALLLFGQMLVAIVLVHLRNGFLESGGGFEYPLTLGGGSAGVGVLWRRAVFGRPGVDPPTSPTQQRNGWRVQATVERMRRRGGVRRSSFALFCDVRSSIYR